MALVAYRETLTINVVKVGLVQCCLVIACTSCTGGSRSGPSCSGLAATCGPAGVSSCCDSAVVPGGSFFRSEDPSTASLFDPATVSDFRFDTYEVTVGRFRRFVSAGLGTQASPPSEGAGARPLNGVPGQAGWDPAWDTNLAADGDALVAALKCNATHQAWTDTPGANESLPMNCITWYEAMAFCAWDGGFLPTEAEWHYAAVGGDSQRAYPWSDPASSLAIDCSYANYFDDAKYCASPPIGRVNRVGSESPKGDSRWGQADLGGNVAEWALDRRSWVYMNPCNDCAQLAPDVLPQRAARGGRFDYAALLLRGTHRSAATDNSRNPGIGVRCARSP